MWQRSVSSVLLRAENIFAYYLRHEDKYQQTIHLCGILKMGNVELGRAFYRLIQTVPSPGGGLQLIPEKFHNHYLLWESTNTFLLEP